MINIQLLSDICRAQGAPGYENEIRNLILSQLEGKVDHLEVDPMGNIIAMKRGRSRKKLLFSAHMDEIGFIVQHIDDDGFIKFLALGGFDPKTLTAQRVIIQGKKNIIGVMGSKPIHLMSPEERNKVPAIKDYFIDTGLTKTELEDFISVGDPITRERELIEMGDCINAKSLDNRISVYALLQAILEISEPSLDTYAVFSVQEEVGLRGAKVAAHRVQADYAINLDTTIAFDVPGSQSYEIVTRLGQGTAIKWMDSSVLCDQRLIRFLKSCAVARGIPWQPELLPAGGTDTGVVQQAAGGCIAGAISIPTRHIHQVIEMVNRNDVRHTIDLCLEAMIKIDSYDFSF